MPVPYTPPKSQVPERAARARVSRDPRSTRPARRRQTVFRGSYQGQAALDNLSRLLGTELEGDPATFSATYSALSLGGIVLTRWTHGAVWWNGSLPRVGTEVSERGGTPDGRPFVRLFVVVDGALRLGQGNAGDLVGAGGAAFLQGHEQFTYESEGEVTVIVCDVASGDPLTGPVAALAPDFSTIAPGEVLVSAFISFVEDLLRNSEESFTTTVRALVARSLAPLVGSLLTLPQHRRPVELSQRVRRAQIVHYIANHHHDRSLSIGTIATRFGISRRSLQRLFEGERLSVHEVIQARRADRSVALLRDRRYDDYTIQQLARLTGHSDAIAFRRAVVQATGLTPTVLRAWYQSTGLAEADGPGGAESSEEPVPVEGSLGADAPDSVSRGDERRGESTGHDDARDGTGQDGARDRDGTPDSDGGRHRDGSGHDGDGGSSGTAAGSARQADSAAGATSSDGSGAADGRGWDVGGGRGDLARSQGGGH